MSHVASIELAVTDLKALEVVCGRLGLELCQNQKKYKWFGKWLNDWNNKERAAIYQGYDAKTFGQCEHAIRIKGNDKAYEIGLVKRSDGKPGYSLIYDAYCGGFGLEKHLGVGLVKLRQEYAAEVSQRHLARQGYRVRRLITADGSVVLEGLK